MREGLMSSFGLGADYIREKDGIFAILCWLSIVAGNHYYHFLCLDRNQDIHKPLVTVQDIAEGYWKEFGRHYYTRYDYEGLETDQADRLMNNLLTIMKQPPSMICGLKIVRMDEFEYHDPVDDSVSAHQGIRIFTEDGARIIFRLSGTGSSGATIRMYMEKYEQDPERLTLHTAVGLEM